LWERNSLRDNFWQSPDESDSHTPMDYPEYLLFWEELNGARHPAGLTAHVAPQQIGCCEFATSAKA